VKSAFSRSTWPWLGIERVSRSELNALGDLLQTFLRRYISFDRVPAATHWQCQVERAVTSVFHPGGVSFKGWRASMRRAHHRHEVERLAMPPHEDVIAPVEQSLLGLPAEPLLQGRNYRLSLRQNRLPSFDGDRRRLCSLGWNWLPSTLSHWSRSPTTPMLRQRRMPLSPSPLLP